MAEYIERRTGVSIFRAKANMAVLMDAAPYFEKAAQMLEQLPAADVAPVVHGRIVGLLEDGRYRRMFSCCGADATVITQWAWPKYCPNCGAKMDGGDSDAKSV